MALSAGGFTLAPPSIESIVLEPASPLVVGTQVTLTAIASDPDGDLLEYRWDFGDGSPQTDWLLEQSSIEHLYSTAGVLTIFVQVRDPGGALAGRATTVVVHPQVVGRAPTRSSPIHFDAERSLLWVVNPDHDSISALSPDLSSHQEIPVCAGPRSLALDGFDRVWVACRDGDVLALVDADRKVVTKVLALDYGSAPAAIVSSGDGGAVWVAENGPGQLVRWDAATLEPIVVAAIGVAAGGLAISGDGTVLLATQFVSPQDAGTVLKIDTASGAILDAIELPIDLDSPDSGTAGRGVPNALAGVAIAPSHARAFTVAKKDNVLRGEFREGTLLNFETTIRALVSTLDLETSVEIVDARSDLDDQSLPSAVVVSPLGSHLFVTFYGSSRLIALVAATGSEAVRVDSGAGPLGVAIDPETSTVFVLSSLDRTVQAYDAAALLETGFDALPMIASGLTANEEVLPSEVLLGKQIFADARDPRGSQEGYLACASCHFDGGQDARVWDFTQFGEGLRNSTSLRGVGRPGRGLLHWTGNFDEVQDFEIPIRGHFGGTGFMADEEFEATAAPLGPRKTGRSAELDALAAYVNSLTAVDRSPWRDRRGSPSADGTAGRLIFVQSGCLECHSGPAWTDSATGRRHDVGTLGPGSGQRLGGPLDGLDTPTLLGVWKTAPYLHDGSAATLEEVLTSRNAFDAHGVTSTLTSLEIDLLARFLLELDGNEPSFPGPGDILFQDGFESGDLSAWTVGSLKKVLRAASTPSF